MWIPSLQATWIRNSVLHALKESSQVNVRDLPVDFVYQYSTIETLSRFLSFTASKQLPAAIPSSEDQVAAMLGMVEKFSHNFPQHVPSIPTPSKDTILLTGSTGGLGASVLARLVHCPDVVHIYVLGRKGSLSFLERQKEALLERGYDPAIVEANKVTLLEVDLALPDFGLRTDVFARVSHACTDV